MKEEFLKYVSNFDKENIFVSRKINHSLRVADRMRNGAKSLGWSSEDVELAYQIGMLHDMGRFEQIRVQNDLNIKSDLSGFDHAEYGADYLFKEGNIKNYPVKKEDYSLIEFAIRNHNKIEIFPCSDERVLRFAKLIRDADKTDIIYLFSIGELEKKEDDSPVSEEVRKSFDDRKPILFKYVKTNNDGILTNIALAFDINYSVFLKDMKAYLEKFYERVCIRGNLENMYNCVHEYLEERIDEEC